MIFINIKIFFISYFNYRTTRFLAEEGFYKFHNWFDDRAWYPLGRIIGGTIYPGNKDLFEYSFPTFLGYACSSLPSLLLAMPIRKIN